MGILIAKKYKTNLFLKLADHTYVECGTGVKGWRCWGGKKGGSAFNYGNGSTKRAEKIAEKDERAGITRYLIDGVCHQAANRILAPAGILVSAARGYGLSRSIFGTYGRSTFNLHSNVTGDLADCANVNMAKKITIEESDYEHQSLPEAELVKSAKAFYTQKKNHLKITRPHGALEQNLRMFARELELLFNGRLASTALSGLMQAKFHTEIRLTDLEFELQENRISPPEFVREFNKMTESFQNDAGNALTSKKYEYMFGVSPDEHIILADPYALNEYFGAGVAEAVYGDKFNIELGEF